nr:nucleotidyltransferase family protein [Thioalkalivibrio sp. ALJ24]
MPRALDHLLTALTQPAAVESLQLSDWDPLLRVARAASLEARLHALLEEQGLLARVPARPRRHLAAAGKVAAQQHQRMRWEVEQVHEALGAREAPVVILKGAAYLMADLPCAPGRLFADLDIMVPRRALESTERALFARGWLAQGHDEYDQTYYRRWMHELPPLTHIRRKSVLDVHHTILPPTARLAPDPDKLFAAARPLKGWCNLLVLAPADMVLHSATHLFHDGELENGLRDLADLDALLRHFAERDSGFWEQLTARAFEMDLARPLYYALRYGREFLATPIPDTVYARLSPARPATPLLVVMDALFRRGLKPHHWICDGPLSGTARWCLYVRSHYLRMPLRLLLPHLVRKAIKERRAGKREQPDP